MRSNSVRIEKTSKTPWKRAKKTLFSCSFLKLFNSNQIGADIFIFIIKFVISRHPRDFWVRLNSRDFIFGEQSEVETKCFFNKANKSYSKLNFLVSKTDFVEEYLYDMSVHGREKSKTVESFPSYHFIALTYFVHTLMTSGQSLMCQLHYVEATKCWAEQNCWLHIWHKLSLG